MFQLPAGGFLNFPSAPEKVFLNLPFSKKHSAYGGLFDLAAKNTVLMAAFSIWPPPIIMTDKEFKKKCDRCQKNTSEVEPKRDLAGNIIPNSYVCVKY